MDATERRTEVIAEAEDWWHQLRAGDVPRSVREGYVDWLRESPIHVAEMLRMAQIRSALEQFQRWDRIPEESKIDSQAIVVPLHRSYSEVFARGVPTLSTWRRAVAIGVVLSAILTVWLLVATSGRIIATERGERREMALSDGSILQIDPETRLRLHFSAQTRDIWLERGRAVFKVAKNPIRPFEVHVDNTTVRAVGTAFGVDRQDKDIVVTVAEGVVAVSRSEFSHLDTGSRLLAPVTVAAGQQLNVSEAGYTEPVHKVDSMRALAWADGRLVFESDTLSNVARQFNRYNRIQIHVTDGALGSRPVSGVFNADDPESFIAFLQSTNVVKVERRGDNDITIAMR